MRAAADRSLLVLLMTLLLAACAGCGATTSPSLNPTARVAAPTGTLAGATPASSPALAPTSTQALTPAPTTAPTPAPTPPPEPLIVTVAPGDTIWGIAARYGVSLAAVLAANPQIGEPSLIRVGEPIHIPPKAIAGWPTVSQAGVTMSGRDLDEEWWGGGPVIRITMTGLAPGEVVSLSGSGEYKRRLSCGPLPSGCGPDVSEECWPVYGRWAKGRVRVSAKPTADASGTAEATLRFAIREMEDACPVEGNGWLPSSGAFNVHVTDDAHGLSLTPEGYSYGP